MTDQNVKSFFDFMIRPIDIFNFFKLKSVEELQSVPDIGPEIARSIFEYFHNVHNEKFIDKLAKAGVKILHDPTLSRRSPGPNGAAKPTAKIFVLTGILKSLTRDQAKEKIRQLGGDISESVSKKTNYVIVGYSPGKKYDQAEKLGVKVLDEAGFLKLLSSL